MTKGGLSEFPREEGDVRGGLDAIFGEVKDPPCPTIHALSHSCNPYFSDMF